MLHRFGRANDNFETPLEVWKDILPFVPTDKTLCDPFYFNGASKIHLKTLGIEIIHEQGSDFFENDQGDMILTNPPFSKKRSIFKEILKRQKPFMMLVPLDTLCALYFKPFLPEITVFIPPRRINFTPGSKCAFNSVWLSWRCGHRPGLIQM